ncbi:MAG: mechanosensitive ion channel [Chloroflexi bacterium]|nr:mechanosensitive ion channel [Chloroflexota bacterium]MBP8057732.1 mechanosensitive ion channel [Chloroflexota bacterium]
MKAFLDTLTDLTLRYGLSIVGAFITAIVGYLLSRFITALVKGILERARVDATLVSFATHLLYYFLLIFTAVAALNRLGIATASLVAVLGAAGLAVGLALQGSLSNFAAGVLIILFRPYKVGDFVKMKGETGYVVAVEMLFTTLRTLDNRAVIIPNAAATGDTIINYSANDLVRLDLIYGIGYKDDLRRAKQILLDLMLEHPRIVKEPKASVGVWELSDSSVNLVARPYVHVDDMTRVKLDLNEQAKLQFDAEGITFPFPQREIHVYQAQ